MLAQTSRPAAERHFDLPAWIVTVLGLSLGLLGIAHLIVHPEPPSIWAFEGIFVVVPAATLAYGGHWIAIRSPDRADRWVAAGWTLSGAVITSTFITGYILSEQLNGTIITEIEQLALFGALSGSFVAFLVVITIQNQYRSRKLVRADGGSDPTVFTARNARVIVGMLRRGKVGGVTGLVTEVCFGRNLWMAYLNRFKATDGLVPFETGGVTLFLDPGDRGISKDLLTYGRREEAATEVMRRETESLRSSVDGPITALDIGANRGYYAFQVADLLDDRATVFAIEPEPNNVTSLRRGIEANRLENVTIDQGAIGVEDGVEELMVSTRSNSHTLNADIPDSMGNKYRSTIEVPVWSIESFLERHGLEPADIDLVKLDVEGYESAVIESMEPLFDAGGPDLLFVELHPHRVPTGDLHEIVDTIETGGFEIVKANSSVADELSTYQAVREHVASDDGSHTVELIVRKPRTKGDDSERPA